MSSIRSAITESVIVPNWPELHYPTATLVALGAIVASCVLLFIVPFVLSKLLGKPTGKIAASRIATWTNRTAQEVISELNKRLESLHFMVETGTDGQMIGIRPPAPQTVGGTVIYPLDSLPVSMRADITQTGQDVEVHATIQLETTVLFGKDEETYLQSLLSG